MGTYFASGESAEFVVPPLGGVSRLRPELQTGQFDPHASSAMKISYLMYDPVPRLTDLDRIMAGVAALGYQGIELVATHPLGYAIEEVVALSEKHKLAVVSLLSGWSYANEGLCLSSPDANVRLRAVERIREYAGHAAQLGKIVVVGLMQGLRGDEPDEETANARIADGLRQAARAAEALGVTLVLEPVNHLQVGFNHSAEEAAAMVRRVGSPALHYMLDTIHMNIEERSILQTIRDHGPRIRHFHLCETNGGPFGAGNLDFPAVLAALRESGYNDFVSVKIYRKATWQEAARSASMFLKQCGVQFRN
jgi:sugar phosphate isomerase/epimerase